jgi:hypothetical protein
MCMHECVRFYLIAAYRARCSLEISSSLTSSSGEGASPTFASASSCDDDASPVDIDDDASSAGSGVSPTFAASCCSGGGGGGVSLMDDDDDDDDDEDALVNSHTSMCVYPNCCMTTVG